MYRLKPVGRHHLEICNSVSCWALGSEQLLHHAKEKLGVHAGEVTPDGMFSVGEVACLAGCGYAPAMIVNNYRYCESMTPARFDALVEELKSKHGEAMAEFPANQDTGRAHG